MRHAGHYFLCWPSGARGDRAHSLLELHWRDVAQSRVQPAAVVDLVDEVRKAHDNLIEGLVVAEVNFLALVNFSSPCNSSSGGVPGMLFFQDRSETNGPGSTIVGSASSTSAARSFLYDFRRLRRG
jgi:hypothetical protein